jgi:hypothetical protein
MLYILTSTETILNVDVRVQESRVGDSNVEGVLNLKLKQTLTAQSFAEQQAYLTTSATAAYVSFNKLDQRHRFRASVNLLACNNETYNFTQGSSSSGLGYALACFDAWWRINIQKNISFAHPVFATGEVLTSGHIKSIGHIVEKLESTCKYVEKHQDSISSFYLCYPQDNDKDIPEPLRKRVEILGGILIPSERLQHTLGQLLGDEYDGDPLGRWQPFKGLKSFDYEDSVRFFGREIEIKSLLVSLKDNNEALVISGVSGSGKSSLIKAGLIPALERESTALYWKLTTLENIDLLDFILITISEAWGINIEKLKELHLESNDKVIELILTKLIPSSKHCVVCLDQFEQVFSQPEFIPKSDLYLINRLNTSIEQLKIILCIKDEYLPHFIDADLLSPNNIFKLSSEMPSYVLGKILNNQTLFSGLTFEINEKGISLDKYIIEEAMLIKQATPIVGYFLEGLYKIAKGDNSSILKFEYYNEVGGLIGAATELISSVTTKNKNKDKDKKCKLYLLLETFIDINDSGELTLKIVDTKHPNIQEMKSLIDDLKKVHLILAETNINNKSISYYLAHQFLLEEWSVIDTWKQNAKQYILWKKQHENKFLKWHENKEKYEKMVTKYSDSNEWGNAFISGWITYNKNIEKDKYLLSLYQALYGLIHSQGTNDRFDEFLSFSFFRGVEKVKNLFILIAIITTFWYFN